MNKYFIGLAIAACIGFSSPALAVSADSSATIIPLDAKAWAGSSVNVLANVRQTLFTEGVMQYAGYYAADGALVVAKRRIGEGQWQIQKTAFKGNVYDAHNHISLVVDGGGYLHVAWNHHGSPLHYARGSAPGSLELGPMASMVGTQERSVTYPQFIRMPDGDVMFQYRDGGSGNGRLVMNRFLAKSGQWQRVQENLIDGEGRRSAYWDMTVDRQGVLHLAWIWRDTPDVASNHDLAYARSVDGGASWTGLDGKPLALPITQANASYALAIPQKSNLMNAPMIATDRDGRPFITSYWSPRPGDKPRFHVVYANAQGWNVIAGPESGENFTLSGTATKSPPISRANLLIERGGKNVRLNLVYRNNQGRVVAATLDTLDAPAWTEHALTSDSVGAWEPAFDPVQWSRLGQSQMLIQFVQQKDGNDKQAEAAASSLGVLVWSPDWESHQAQHPTPAHPMPAILDAPLTK